MKHSLVWQFAKKNATAFFSVKKALSALIICAALLSACGGGGKQNGAAKSNQKPPNDLQKEHLSGDVVSVRQRVYWALEKFGRMDKGKLQNLPVHDFLKLYDNDGFLIEETHYDVNNKVVSSKKIEYGESHRIDKEEFYKGNVLDEYIVYTYDENNRMAKKEKINGAGKIKEWYGYIYHPQTGLLQDEDVHKPNGDLLCKYVYIYENSKLSEKQKYWGGGTLAQKEYYIYNSKGQLYETNVEKYNNKQAVFVSQTRYEEYNSFGDYTVKTEFDKDGDETSIVYYAYDSYGNLTKNVTKSIKITAQTVEVTNEYSEDGNEGEEQEDAETEIDAYDTYEIRTEKQLGNTYTYEYDDNKNWTQKITYKIDSNAAEEKTRQFYYDRVITYK